MANGKCPLHGGKSLAGIASPAFVNGKTSKYLDCLPDTLAKHFDPDAPRLVELTEDLALLKAGILELLERAKSEDAGMAKWKEAAAAFGQFVKARDRKQAKVMVQQLDVLERLLVAGAAAETDRAQVWDLIDRRARAVAVESRRRKDEHDMVERSEFARFAAALLKVIAGHIEDRQLRQTMQDDLLRILALSQVPYLPAQTLDGETVPA